ncbi:hypothetical protein ACFW5I_10465 [Streptomyces sp. NPDC058818]|uniref:hypothetical protein n=1 Tax=Streptomyces sp. NPDC058818 TaxID=3346640 RepID=UPI0036C1B222
MSELWVAVIAAGSAVSGAAVGGWFARSAGLRQAEAAKHAGDRQADALLRTVESTLDEQRRARIEDWRRQAYVELVRLAQDVSRDRENRETNMELQKALSLVVIEGPSEVTLTAIAYVRAVRQWRESPVDPEPVSEAYTDYLNAVREALGIRLTE